MKRWKLAFLALLLCSCSGATGPAGPQGPQGPQGEQGEQGIPGPQGSQGEQGEQGEPGVDGATWLTGEGVPSSSLGKDGDFYLDVVTCDVYQKDATSWQKIGNIKGEIGQQGPQGSQGEQGEPGVDGTVWFTGQGLPDEAMGDLGDFYLDTLTCDLYEKLHNGWHKIGNIKGEKGDAGHDADTYGKVYTVTFDVDEEKKESVTFPDGTGTAGDCSIQVNYGETIDLPIAERTGYIFQGWFTGFGVNDGQFTNVTPVTRDITLYPSFRSQIVYDVRFHGNGGYQPSPFTICEGESLTAFEVPDSEKVYCTFVGWFLDEGLTIPLVLPYEVHSDLDLYAKFADIYYTVDFDSDGGNEIASRNYKAGSALGTLPVPIKPYYTFIAWYIKDTDYYVEEGDHVEEDLHLVARYEATYSTLTYDYCYNNIKNENVVQNGVNLEETLTPVRSDYTFLGWYLDDGYVNKLSLPYMITEDLTLYAKWSYNDPYATYTKIYDKTDLMMISNMNGKYVLMNDIVLDDENFAIGTASNPFNGIFDGNGHTISGLALTASHRYTDLGMFGVNSGTITDLKVAGYANYGPINLSLLESGGSATAGTICGTNSGTISRCQSSIALTIKAPDNNTTKYINVGGIVGTNNLGGVIRDCCFKSSLAATQESDYTGDGVCARAAGIAGYNLGTIDFCMNAGSIDLTNGSGYKSDSSSNKTFISGLAVGGTITNSVSLRSVSGSSVRYGDPIGYGATMDNCYYYESLSVSAYKVTNSGNTANVYSLNSSNFYRSTIGFDSNVWDFVDLDFNNGAYPELW